VSIASEEPSESLPWFGSELVEGAVNRLLALDPGLATTLATTLAGARVAIDVEGLATRIMLVIQEQGIAVDVRRRSSEAANDDPPPDVTISGLPLALLRTLGRDADQQTATGAVRIEGDMRVARRLQALLAGIEIDLEEPLARVFGDVGAHQIARVGRGLSAWGRMASARLLAQGAEYLAREAGVLVTLAELDQFTLQVEDLRDDVERCAARVTRIERRRGVGAR